MKNTVYVIEDVLVKLDDKSSTYFTEKKTFSTLKRNLLEFKVVLIHFH